MKVLLPNIFNDNQCIPLSLLYLKSYAQKCVDLKQTIDIQILEFYCNDSRDTIIEEILDENPDICGFSCYNWNIFQIIDISCTLKRQLPDIKIILGGPVFHSRKFSEEILIKFDCVDVIVRGEGEYAFCNLLLFFL